MYTKRNISRLFEANPTIYRLLKDALDPSSARDYLMGYVGEVIRLASRESLRIQPLEWTLQNQCLLTFRRIISVRSERISKFSIVRLLWALAHEETDKIPSELNDGFFSEMIHLFLGMRRESGIYDQEPYPEFAKQHGRKASIIRSRQLDEIGSKSLSYIQRYPTGLDKGVREERRKNKLRILNFFNATESDWNDYRWHLKHIIRDADTLGELVTLTDPERKAIEKAKSEHLPFGITPYYVSLMDQELHRRHDHAVRAQVIPPLDYIETMRIHRGNRVHFHDFMLEQDTSPIDLITRRYPMIVILKPYNTCSQICVYCQRNWEINDVLNPRAMASKNKLLKAIDWIRSHSVINEVLVTGGDPLVMNDHRIDFVLSKLADIDHIERIRIGSRTPVVLPQRITESLIQIIQKYHEPGKREVAVVTHFEHPYEVTPDAMQAVQKFKMAGMSVYNQAVFTIENSRRFELVALRRALRIIGVDSYYTFNIKGKEEIQSYRVPLARLQQEIKEEARLVPGLVRTDEPVYNVPRLGKNYIKAQQHHSLLTILPDGRRVYEFHPWEKKLSLADTYIDTDVSIHDFLTELKKRGENPEDYKTIWYYY
ncbi:KamA family radical SAM protein [bacterium]|nr:KamA family radical SAM protein [bacterium]RQV92063.1 MAG: KamA family radical SAM protein [bacterium]